jgi:hypothetical protein
MSSLTGSCIRRPVPQAGTGCSVALSRGQLAGLPKGFLPKPDGDAVGE